MELPTGAVSLLFTDVEGSTRLLDALGAGYDDVMEAEQRILRSAIDEHRGVVFGTEGDALFAVFLTAGDAVAAARDAQRRLTEHLWPEGAAVRVRMAVHTGEVRLVGDSYYGMALHVAARVCSAGHGGQVLLTGATRSAAEGFDVRDLGERRLKDLSEPVPISQLVGVGLAESFPELRTLSGTRNNLPADTDAFVGRTVELASLIAEFSSHRLVTLTGAGGSGKTRLSLRAAAHGLGSTRDVWFVELAPLTDPALITAQVAGALGLGESATKPLRMTLVDWLRANDSLLVLDNCEHLVEGVAEFVDDVLRSCPELLILTTSREPLGIRGERTVRVPPLALDGEAATLFLTRAQTMVPGFDRDAVDRRLVDQVCRRLDGLPLALELAAARLRSLSLDELAARLDDRFRLLTGGNRTSPSRQRTLGAVVDWSYDLLSQPEGRLFRAVSVFPDSFTLQAAAGVTGDDTVDVIDGLGRLVEKSLVVPAEARAGVARYQLLETLRQYGRDRLRERDEEEQRRDRLLGWAMTFVERLENDLRTPRMDAALADVMPERVSMRAAMEWAIERNDLSAALRLVTTIPLGLTTERRAMISDLLDRGGESLAADVVARAQLTLGDLAFEQGDWAAAASAGAEARIAFTRLGDRHHAAWAAHVYSAGAWGAGDLSTLDRLLVECREEFQALDSNFGIAHTLWRSSLREPDPGTARAMAAEAERRYRELGAPIMRAHALEARGIIEIEAGDLDSAAPFLHEATEVLAAVGNAGCTAHALEAVAVWAAERGDPSSAGELVGAAESLRSASGAGHKPWEVRARHGGSFDADVLGDDGAVRDAIQRGRQSSLAAAAELVAALLAPATDARRRPA